MVKEVEEEWEKVAIECPEFSRDMRTLNFREKSDMVSSLEPAQSDSGVGSQWMRLFDRSAVIRTTALANGEDSAGKGAFNYFTLHTTVSTP